MQGVDGLTHLQEVTIPGAWSHGRVRGIRRTQGVLASAGLVAALSSAFALVTASPAGASVNRFVDASNPSCTDTGTGTSTAPYCTIQAAASAAQPGDTVQVESGTYTESVTISRSGTSSAPITFEPAPGASVTVSGGYRGFAINGSSSSVVGWINIVGFNVTNTSDYGIYLKYATNITISKNHVSYAGHPVSGQTRGGIAVTNSTNSLISANTTDHNTDAGIYVVNGSTGIEIRDNKSYSNARQYTRAAPGIDVRAAGNTIDRNVTYGNEDSGIQLYNGGNNCVVYDNISYNNGDHGIDTLNSSGAVIVSNSVYNNHTAGINVEGTSTGATVENNISMDNGLTSTTTKGDIRVDPNAAPGTKVDYDVVYLSSSGMIMTWGWTTYPTLAAFQAASGQESHGIAADPRWVAPISGNFELRSGSPAIDSADSGAPDEPPTDEVGHARVDDPATPNTGVGPEPYYDRGALEYQPTKTADLPPAVSFTVTPTWGTAPLPVSVDASKTTDTDTTPVATYTFDFGDGTVVGPQASATATHTYATGALFTVKVTATDAAGLAAQASAKVDVAPPAGTNLVGNPGFETGTSGWNVSGVSGVTLTQVAGGHSGGSAALLSNTSTTNVGSCTLNDAPNWVGRTQTGTFVYQASLWVRADTPGATLQLRLREYNGSTLVGQASRSITLSGSWQQITVSYTPGAAGTSNLDYNAYVSNAAPGDCFYADDAAITLAQQ